MVVYVDGKWICIPLFFHAILEPVNKPLFSFGHPVSHSTPDGALAKLKVDMCGRRYAGGMQAATKVAIANGQIYGDAPPLTRWPEGLAEDYSRFAIVDVELMGMITGEWSPMTKPTQLSEPAEGFSPPNLTNVRKLLPNERD